MKRLKYLLISLILLIIMVPVVFAKDNVFIEKIELVSKSDNTIINNKPSFSGIEMNYDISFKQVNDNVKYKITIKNNTNKDYKIANDTSFSESNYIKYDYEVGDILKANKTIDVYLTITYNKKIDDSKFVDEKYDEANKAVVKLLNNDTKEEVNPNTSSQMTIFIILGITFTILIVLLIKNKKIAKATYLLIVIGIAFVPILSKAIEEIKLQANVKVEVLKTYKVTYYYEQEVLVSAEEKNNDKYTGCFPYYIGEVSPENVIYRCSEQLSYEDPVRYYYGEVVKPKTLEYNRYDFYENDESLCDSSNWEYSVCTKISEPTVYHQNGWSYNIPKNNSSIDEAHSMNFKCINDDNSCYINWANLVERQVWFDNNAQFSMPKHDVVLVPIPPM